MSEKVLVFANDANSAAELCSGAEAFASEVILVTSSGCTDGADAVYTYPADSSAALYAGAIAALARELSPRLVLCEAGADGRLVAAAVCSALGVSPLCDVMSLEYAGGAFTATRLVYGGSAVKTESCAVGTAVAVVAPGTFEAKPGKSGARTHMLEASGEIILREISRASASSVNLPAAKKVLGVGRGLASADNVPLAEELAGLLGAEIGCTRPVAEEEHWYTKDRYIGVSGCMLKPAFYMAVGISGQIQHMVGVNQSGVIFSIDKDENAPIIRQSDYSLIGDVNTVLPALIAKLKE